MLTYEPTHGLKQYAPLLRELLAVATSAADRLRKLRKPVVPDQILLAILGKAIDGLSAILILQDHGLRREAQSLARSLFELWLSCDAFIKLMRIDVRAACERVMDAVMLEKSNRLVLPSSKASNWLTMGRRPKT